uniref:RING-type domain-containing protein n=1 Tax=Anopheles atroparvus TaxID=41427 RepID=A0A182ISD9_ANOAO
MAPSNWIHCSLCYNLMLKKEHKFYHLSCRHILCRPCMAKTNRGTVCPVCQGSLRRFVELNNQMERKDKMWYDPSATKIFEFACQTLMFQQKHREHLIQRIVQARKSLPRLNELEEQLRRHVVETQRRYEKLRSFRRSLQENLRRSLLPSASGTIQSSGRSTRTPAFSMQPSGQLRVPMRRMSTESAFSLMQYSMQPQRNGTFNGSFAMQQPGSGKICNRRLSNDSGIGAITPNNASFIGSAKRVRFNTSANMFNRSTFNTNM